MTARKEKLPDFEQCMAELEALTRLVALRRGNAQEPDTRRRLRDYYDSFTEGFDTPQLAAAKAVLEADDS